MRGIDMKNTFLASVMGLLILVSLASAVSESRDNPFPGHKVTINLEDSKIQLTGTENSGERLGSARFTGGEFVLDENEIKGGSFTINLNSLNNKDSKARFEIKKVSKLPVTRTEQGDIKYTHRIVGDLTVKGQTKTISFDASVNMLKGKVSASSAPIRIDEDTSLKLDLVTD
jgi:hypothetical protein